VAGNRSRGPICPEAVAMRQQRRRRRGDCFEPTGVIRRRARDCRLPRRCLRRRRSWQSPTPVWLGARPCVRSPTFSGQRLDPVSDQDLRLGAPCSVGPSSQQRRWLRTTLRKVVCRPGGSRARLRSPDAEFGSMSCWARTRARAVCPSSSRTARTATAGEGSLLETRSGHGRGAASSGSDLDARAGECEARLRSLTQGSGGFLGGIGRIWSRYVSDGGIRPSTV
jgi:hypothetical protein